MRGANVRTLHVLAPAPVKAGPAAAAADPTPPTVPAAPVERRPPPDGYHRAIEAHRQAARPSRLDPAITEAVQRQTAAMRELSRRAFSEPEVVPDDAPTPIEQVRIERRRQAEVTRAAALHGARQERGGWEAGVVERRVTGEGRHQKAGAAAPRRSTGRVALESGRYTS
ncbi:hypothetical protein ABZ467_35855 [Streptomyces sp. NPDC005727]|uniref:hypothetical protein n=1 Tax=unclassified Streptomyces TaxID=2593676 RepID=UPI0033D9A9E9